VDARSDIYSLGVTLYELVTLRPAYSGTDRPKLLHQIASGSIPSVRQQNPQVPPELARIISKTTERQLARRYQTARELSDDLRRFLQSPTDEPPTEAFPKTLPRPTRISPRGIAIGLLAAFAAVVCAAIVLLVRDNDGMEKARVTLKEGDRIELVQQGAGLGGKKAAAAGAAKAGYSLSFDGKDDVVEIPSLKYDGSHPITVELVANPRDDAHFRQLVIIGNYDYSAKDGQDFGLALFQRGDSYPTPTFASWSLAYAAKNKRSHSLIGPPEAWKAGRPSHIAFVGEGRKYLIYFDGKLWKHSEMGDDPAPSDKSFTIGGNPLLKGFFGGKVDEIRISKVARYKRDFNPVARHEPDKHTVALYHCDEGRGKKLVDSSGNKHDGKIVGATWVAGSQTVSADMP
jgi:hypothetical protein